MAGNETPPSFTHSLMNGLGGSIKGALITGAVTAAIGAALGAVAGIAAYNMPDTNVIANGLKSVVDSLAGIVTDQTVSHAPGLLAISAAAIGGIALGIPGMTLGAINGGTASVMISREANAADKETSPKVPGKDKEIQPQPEQAAVAAQRNPAKQFAVLRTNEHGFVQGIASRNAGAGMRALS